MSAREEIISKVKDIVAERLRVPRENLTETSAFVDDLGADSLDQAELVMALEDEFNFQIPEDEAQNIKTIKDAVDYIINKMS
ncbi:MAG: acyl carrier protein [Planctomycetota bacterium]|jgi:acyl carrier protein